jgi:LacI family transcriptional regulator
MAVTITQIAKEAGVSISLVSRLLRGDPNARVSDQRRREIFEIRDRLGGVAPRRKVRGRPSTKRVLVPCNSLFTAEWVQANMRDSQKMRCIETAMRDRGLRMYFAFFEESRMAPSVKEAIYHGDCDALLLFDENVYEWLADFLKTRYVPHVTTHYPAEQYNINTVHHHEPDGFRQAVEHLRGLGHRHIGFVGTPNHYRYPLAVAAIAGAGLAINSGCHCWIEPLRGNEPNANLRRNAHRAMARWLDDHGTATALICSNDMVAQGVLDVMRERRLTPGKDLSIVGHGNHEQRGIEPVGNPVITTVDNPAEQVAQRAADLLINQIEHGQTQIVHERIPTTLVVRNTTGPAPQK